MSNTEEEYFGVFPSMLFLRPDNSPMHFVLELKNKNTKEIEKIMRYCNAKTTHNMHEANGHSIVLVDHNNPVEFDGPAFSLEYVKNCLEEKKLLDISEYKQEATKHPAEGESCMEVVYYKLKTWDKVSKNSSKQTNCRPNSSTKNNTEEESVDCDFQILSDDEELTCAINRYNEKMCKRTTPSSNHVEENYSEPQSLKAFQGLSDDDKLRLDFDQQGPGGLISSTQIEEIADDEHNSDISDSVIHPTEENQENIFCWDDIRELEKNEKILKNPKNISRKKWVKATVRIDLDDEDENENSEGCKEEMHHKTKGSQRSQQRFQLSTDEDDSTEEEAAKSNSRWLSKNNIDLGKKSRSQQNPAVADSNAPSSPAATRQKTKVKNTSQAVADSNAPSSPAATRQKTKVKNTSQPVTSSVDSDEECGPRRRPLSNKHSRQPYTIDERRKILEYIVKHNDFSRVKGTMLWKIMERKKILPLRTWQSMKEHFLKKIVVDLGPYTFLTKDEIRKLKNCGL